jgi:hypothetical protein
MAAANRNPDEIYRHSTGMIECTVIGKSVHLPEVALLRGAIAVPVGTDSSRPRSVGLSVEGCSWDHRV